MTAVQGTGPHDLLEQVQGLIVHNGHVVGIPADGTGNVKHQLRHEEQERGDHIRNILGHLIMAGIQSVHKLARGAIAGHKVVGTNGIALQADTEELGLEAGLHSGEILLQDLVQAFGKDLAVALALDGLVLAAVVHPDVHYTRVALRPAHRIGDAAAALCMLDPEFADGRIGVAQGKVAALRMAE